MKEQDGNPKDTNPEKHCKDILQCILSKIYMFFLYIFLFLKQMNNYPHKTTESVNESTTQCPNLNLTKIKLN